MTERLSWYALDQGVANIRVILTTSAGFWHAGELCPYAPERVTSGMLALTDLERDSLFWRNAHEIRAAGLRHRLDIEAIEREVPLSDTGAWR